jgi:nucleoside-diphosphate-sugar epimerase
MRVLVTGATGFVGASLTRRLVGSGWEIHILTRAISDRWRIADLLPQVTEHLADLRNGAAVEAIVSQVKPDTVCHFSTYGGFSSQRDTAAILETNLTGTVQLLAACERAGFKSFINIGSSSEYGIKSGPMRENDLLEPLDDYGVSKAAAALYCRSRALQNGLPTVTLRLFSPFGPWDDPQRLIPYLVKSYLRGESPQLANPRSVRDFVFIDDALDLICGLIERPAGPGEIFNAGSGRQHSVGEVVTLLEEMLRPAHPAKWGACQPRRQEPENWSADLSLVKEKRDWLPRTTMAEGLAKTVAWMKEHLAQYP